MYLLGISAFYHDSAACLIKDGAIIAAAQEERLQERSTILAFPGMLLYFVSMKLELRLTK